MAKVVNKSNTPRICRICTTTAAGVPTDSAASRMKSKGCIGFVTPYSEDSSASLGQNPVETAHGSVPSGYSEIILACMCQVKRDKRQGREYQCGAEKLRDTEETQLGNRRLDHDDHAANHQHFAE